MIAAASGRQATTARPSAPARDRVPIALAALLAVALAAGQLAARHRDLATLRARAAALDLAVGDGGELERALARESDPGERRLVLARAALADALADATPGADGRRARRFEAARELAGEALARLPASAEAPRLAGVATALERLARRDPALITGIADWERPLEVAGRRAPGAAAADRALAAAWLEIWPALRGERRERARAALAAAFREPDFFDRALPRWLEQAGSLERAAELLPDAPATWDRLGRVAIERGDLARAAGLRERWRRAVAGDLAARLAAARRLPPEPARLEIDELLAAAPPDVALAPLVERALAARPAGPPSPALAAAAARWLAWARPLCLALDCPLASASIDRLAGAAGDRLSTEEAAWAALAAGERTRAERFARRSGALWSEAWAPYLLLAARQRLAAGDPAGARALLGQVHRAERGRLPWRRLARAAGLAPDAAPPTAAAAWEPTEWEWRAGAGALAFETARAGTALRLALAAPAPRPALLALEWDGRAAPPVVVPAGATALRLPGALARGAHLVRIALVAGEMPAVAVTALE